MTTYPRLATIACSLLALSVVAFPREAQGHGMSIHAHVEEGHIHGDVTYLGGSPVVHAEIEILDADREVLATTETDHDGNFELEKPDSETLTVVASTGDGHLEEYTISGETTAPSAEADHVHEHGDVDLTHLAEELDELRESQDRMLTVVLALLGVNVIGTFFVLLRSTKGGKAAD